MQGSKRLCPTVSVCYAVTGGATGLYAQTGTGTAEFTPNCPFPSWPPWPLPQQ